MQNFRYDILLIVLIYLFTIKFTSFAEDISEYNFKVVVLGSGGGPYENNLSSYLISSIKDNNYIVLDAGTILHGIKIANRKGAFKDISLIRNSELSPEIYLLENNIKAYIITHAHIDHLAGLITSSPYDTNKYIYGLPKTIEIISNHIFNWQIWPNFGNEGKKPNLSKYIFKKMEQGVEYNIPDTSVAVKALPLSHSNNFLSTAFLIRSGDKYILYIGDTGPDKMEKSDNLNKIWNQISPLVKSNKLSAIFIECSYTNDRPDNILYGHLTPKWLMHELNQLSSIVIIENSENTLAGLPFVITHIKTDTRKNFNTKEVITGELKRSNNLGVKFIIPEQGDKLLF